MQSSNRLESIFYTQFNALELTYQGKEKTYKVRAVRPSKINFGFDFLIEIGKRPIAIIEVKNTPLLLTYDYSRIVKYAAENNIRFIILTDNDLFIVIDRNQ